MYVTFNFGGQEYLLLLLTFFSKPHTISGIYMEATSVSANVCQICIKGISVTITQSRVIVQWERKYTKIVIMHLYATWIRSVCSIGRIISVADKPFNVCNLYCKYMYLIPRKQVEYFYSNLMCKNSLKRNTFAYSHCVVNKYIICWLNIARKLLTNACIVRSFSSQWPRMASEGKTMSSKFQIHFFYHSQSATSHKIAIEWKVMCTV